MEIVEKGLAGSRVIINRVVAKYCNHWSGTPESRSTDALLFD